MLLSLANGAARGNTGAQCQVVKKTMNCEPHKFSKSYIYRNKISVCTSMDVVFVAPAMSLTQSSVLWVFKLKRCELDVSIMTQSKLESSRAQHM